MARKKITEQKITPEEKIAKLESELELARSRYRQRESTEYGKQKRKEQTFNTLKMAVYDLIEMVLELSPEEKIMQNAERIRQMALSLKI